MSDSESIEVTLPSGEIARFPAGTPIEQMEQAISAYLYADQPSPKTTVSGTIASAVRGGGPYGMAAAGGAALGAPLGGVGVVPGAMAGIGAMGLVKFIGDPLIGSINSRLGTNFQQPTEALNGLFDRMGIERPDTATEDFIQIVSEGVFSGPTMAGRSAGRQMVSGGAQAVAGQQAGESAEALGAGPLGQLGASLVASVGTGVATNPRASIPQAGGYIQLAEQATLAKAAARGDIAAKKTLASQAANGIDPDTFKAAEDLGVAKYMTPGQLTTNKAFRELEMALSKYPDSAVKNKRIDGVRQFAAQTEDMMQRYFKGDAFDSSALNEKVFTRMRTTVDKLAERSDKLYEQINAKVNLSNRVPAKNTVSLLEQRISELGGVDNLSPLERNVYRRLRPTPRIDKNTKKVYQQHPTYGNIDEVRKLIGEASRGQGEFKDSSSRIIAMLYDTLNIDQGRAIHGMGVGEGLWESAKGLVRMRKSVEDSMTILFGKELDKSLVSQVESGTKALARGDAAKFNAIMQSVPRNMRQNVAINGITTMLKRSAEDGDLDFKSFVKWYGAVKQNKAAYKAIMGELPPEARTGLENIYKVGRRLEIATENQAGYVGAALQSTQSLISQLSFVAARATGVIAVQSFIGQRAQSQAGSYTLAYGAANALQASKKNKSIAAVNRLLGSPEFIDLVGAMADGRDTQRYVNRLSRSQTMMSFVRAANLPDNQAIIETWINNVISNPNADAANPFATAKPETQQ